MTGRAWIIGLFVLIPWLRARGATKETPQSAAWELKLLGINSPERLAEAQALRKARRVRLALVGADGVSRKALGELLDDRSTLTYHGCTDPERETHDTGMARIVLNLTRALGTPVDLHVWQAGGSYDDYAAKFREVRNSSRSDKSCSENRKLAGILPANKHFINFSVRGNRVNSLLNIYQGKIHISMPVECDAGDENS